MVHIATLGMFIPAGAGRTIVGGGGGLIGKIPHDDEQKPRFKITVKEIAVFSEKRNLFLKLKN